MRLGWLTAALALGTGAALGATTGDTPSTVKPPRMEAESMAFLGLAHAPCGVFVQAVEAERRARPPGDNGPETAITRDYGAFLSWADGYLTARNQVDTLARLVGQSSTHEQRGRWLELFCRANPAADYLGAVLRLRDDLIEHGE